MDSKPLILIVDDSPDMRLLMSMMLERAGYEVRQVSSGKEALKVLDQFTPALIITDFMMPDMNGVELCRFIRQRADTQSTPIMLRSYRVLDSKLIEEAQAAGANDVMHLLVVQRDFIPRVKALLGRGESA
jgi:two-component system phosphate regulon response regulator PhoB